MLQLCIFGKRYNCGVLAWLFVVRNLNVVLSMAFDLERLCARISLSVNIWGVGFCESLWLWFSLLSCLYALVRQSFIVHMTMAPPLSAGLIIISSSFFSSWIVFMLCGDMSCFGVCFWVPVIVVVCCGRSKSGCLWKLMVMVLAESQTSAREVRKRHTIFFCTKEHCETRASHFSGLSAPHAAVAWSKSNFLTFLSHKNHETGQIWDQ